MRKIRTAAALLARTHFAAGARWVIPGAHGVPWRIGPDEVHLIENASLDPSHWLCILSHLFGGNVMGTDPTTSVCDANGKVHGYEGLQISDASMIPTNLGVNPQHTIMSLARHHAEMLAGGR
jgi:choline dehydrogenase-like flavoprotein